MGEQARGKDKGKVKPEPKVKVGSAMAPVEAPKKGNVPKERNNNSTKTRLCAKKCVSEFQDKLYGPGMRVHNPAKTSNKGPNNKLVCTVCGNKVDL